MPGGDLATTYPERMLYGILPEQAVADILASRGWTEVELDILEGQLEKDINVARTSSTGRVLDAISALLGICREKTYDGEPAMKLESSAVSGRPRVWDLEYLEDGPSEVLSTRTLCKRALLEYSLARNDTTRDVSDIAASFQYNLARGIAGLAIHAARDRSLDLVTLSGGVAYNRAIRETIADEIRKAGLTFEINADYPLGDGCISYGQCLSAGKREL
jgi:hydrogenase maturation protein HypF